MSLFYTCVPKITIIWCMLPEIWSATDNFLSFWAIFSLLPFCWPWKLKFGKNVKNTCRCYPFSRVHLIEGHMMYVSWDIRHGRIFCHFLPFDPPNNPKTQNSEKNEKSSRRYHFTFVYHKWSSYDKQFLRYGAPDINLC